jgi:hypothetical protein
MPRLSYIPRFDNLNSMLCNVGTENAKLLTILPILQFPLLTLSYVQTKTNYVFKDEAPFSANVVNS